MNVEFEQVVQKLTSILKEGLLTESQLREAVKVSAAEAIVAGTSQHVGSVFPQGPSTYSPWIHNKTGNVYFRLTPGAGTADSIINCTNDRDGQEMVLYTNNMTTSLFVREKQEFLDKFTYAPWWG